MSLHASAQSEDAARAPQQGAQKESSKPKKPKGGSGTSRGETPFGTREPAVSGRDGARLHLQPLHPSRHA
eukprot:11712901-Alexandrium_andersonii.AAC.1